MLFLLRVRFLVALPPNGNLLQLNWQAGLIILCL